MLSQDYPNIEYIVMDGGSTDRTHEILESYGGRLHYFSEPDKGPSDAVQRVFSTLMARSSPGSAPMTSIFPARSVPA